jgi:hypothetical protein
MTRVQLLILTIGLIICSCKGRQVETTNIEERTKEFINEINSEELKTLKHLHFIYRGPREFWQNDSIISSFYSFRFFHDNDTSELAVIGGSSERFIEDFAINLKRDTSISNLKLIKTGNKIYIYKNRNELIKVVDSDSLSKKDPFKLISDVNDLKKKYQLIKITHFTNLGEFIEFYFTTKDVLTYLPDSSNINPQFKDIWTKEWDKGQWINKNWNLRKLEKPIEVGG